MRTCLSWVLGVGLIAAVAWGNLAMAGESDATGKIRLNGDYLLSGPFACKNLSVFLIHGKAKIKGKHIISLSYALEQGVVTIDETGDVNRLTISNHSDTDYVFIQSGDIVKGGRQDRTLAQDALVPPRSNQIPLNAFCVESGRWHKRGMEKADQFSSSKKRLSSRKLKLAAKKAKSQQDVWQAVAAEQEKLSRQIGKSVRKKASATSLQLSMEDEDVEKKRQVYQQALLPVGQREKDAVGLAFAINGQFSTADIYGDPVLFQKLWPKLIEAAAYEAVSQYDAGQADRRASRDEVKGHLVDALNSKKRLEPSTKVTRRTSGETKINHAFETKDELDQVIHLNIMKKTDQ